MLLYFMQMIMDGPKIKRGEPQVPNTPLTAAKTAFEVVSFNTVKSCSNNPESIPRHIRDRESPLMIYIAIKLWCSTRKESLEGALHRLWLCISYKRLSRISIDLANSVVAFYNSVGVVVPPQTRRGVLTIMGYDNYDADPSSTTSMKTSTHGAALSVHQLP